MKRLPPIQNAGGQLSMRFGLLHNVALPTLSNGSDGMKYLALSYVWGNESNKIPIIIDGHTLDVTQNLHAALVHIADKHEQFPLWTDAVCINQSDKDEKIAQIKQMGNIYSSANAVIVFLGLGTKSSDLAMEQVKILGDEALQRGIEIFDPEDGVEWPEFVSSPNREDKVRVVKKLEELMDQYSGSRFSGSRFRVRDILKLFDRPWFTRVWVVQEVVLAPPGAAIFVCGSKRVSDHQFWASTFVIGLFLSRVIEPSKSINGLWTAFRFIFDFWMQMGYPRIQTSNAHHHAVMILNSRRKQQKNMLERNLKDILVQMYVTNMEDHRSAHCKERVDRIRALVSMSIDKEHVNDLLYGEEGTQCWRMEYRSVARYLIEQGHIDILSLCRDRDPGLPSWAPDWSRNHRRPWSGFRGNKDSKGEPLFNAGSGTTLKVYNNTAPHILALDGFLVDTIENNTDIESEWTAGIRDDFNWNRIGLRFRELEKLLSRCTRYDHEAKEAASWKIPIGDKEYSQLYQITRASDSSRDAYELMKNTLDPNKWKFGFGYFRRKGIVEYMTMAHTMHRSRLFISATGYVGLCPSETQKGDAIFVPCGGHVPYIIRPKRKERQTDQAVTEQQQWTLVGEAYVHGIMHGELLANRSDETRIIWLL